MRRDLSTLDRDICQPLGRILQEAFKEGIACRVNIRFDSLQYEGDIIGLQVRPAANVALKADGVTPANAVAYGAQIMPRFNNGIPGYALVGMLVNPILKGTTGNLAGVYRGIELKLETEGAASTREIAGITTVIDCKHNLANTGTYTGGVYVLKADAKPGADKASWTALLKLPDDSELAVLGTPTASQPGNTAAVRVQIGDTIVRLVGYKDA